MKNYIREEMNDSSIDSQEKERMNYHEKNIIYNSNDVFV